MKRLTFILASALLMTACATNQSEKQDGVPAIDINNFDESIARNDDFYQWATGGWQKNNPLKPEYSRYGSNTSSEYRLTTIKNSNGYLNAGTGTVLYSPPDNDISMLYYILGILIIIAFLKLVFVCYNFFFRRHRL